MEFPRQVKFEKALSKDKFHKVTYDTPEYLDCNYFEQIKIENNIKLVVARIFFPSGTIINSDDRITLEDNETSPIVRIKNHDYGNSPFLEVFLGEYGGGV